VQTSTKAKAKNGWIIIITVIVVITIFIVTVIVVNYHLKNDTTVQLEQELFDYNNFCYTCYTDHRSLQVVSFSHFTYLLQLSYFGKVLKPESRSVQPQIADFPKNNNKIYCRG